MHPALLIWLTGSEILIEPSSMLAVATEEQKELFIEFGSHYYWVDDAFYVETIVKYLSILPPVSHIGGAILIWGLFKHFEASSFSYYS